MVIGWFGYFGKLPKIGFDTGVDERSDMLDFGELAGERSDTVFF